MADTSKNWNGIEIIQQTQLELDMKWNHEYGKFVLGMHTMELHTGGWSDNETIISDLQKTVFWALYWQKSERGGHYYFEFPHN